MLWKSEQCRWQGSQTNMSLGKAGSCPRPSAGPRPQLFRPLLRVGGPEAGWPRGWEVARFSEVFLDAYPSPTQDLTALLCSAPRAVGRKQFMRFEWASHAAEALGCEYEDLNTSTFKHHLRQIIEQVTSGPSRRSLEDEAASSGTIPRPPWVDRVPAEPPFGDTPASFRYSSRIY